MPRCESQTPPPSSRIKIYLARRLTPVIVLPASCAAKSGRTRVLSRGSRTSTERISRPVTRAPRPRQIVSTSGSSGIKNNYQLSAVGFQLETFKRAGEADELLHAERLAAPARIDALGGEQRVDLFLADAHPAGEIVFERLSPLPERGADQTSQRRDFIRRDQP